MARAQRLALQLPPRRAAQQSAKMPTISRAEGGQLQAPVGWQLGRAALAIFKPVFEYGNFVGAAQQLIGLIQERQRHHRQSDFVNYNPDFGAIHIHYWLPGSVRQPMLHVANNLD